MLKERPHNQAVSAMLSILIIVFISCPIRGEEQKYSTSPDYQMEIQREVPDDPYLVPNSDDRVTTTAYRSNRAEILTRQVNVTLLGSNIVGDAANEPSMAVDPTNHNRIVIGWRQFDTIASNFRQAGYSYTTDGGDNWIFPGVIEPGVFRSDPVLDSDATGVFYYNSLTYQSGDFICSVFKSYDGGATWDEGTFAQGGDKQWMIIDKTGGIGNGHIYSFWTHYWSICEPGHFTMSIDGGASYPSCDEIPGEPYWGTLAVGPEGELYIGGVETAGESYAVVRSTSAMDTSQAFSWDLSTEVDLGGMVVISEGPNPGGLLGQTWIATDKSEQETRGNVYLLASVSPVGDPDPIDVNFVRSEDGGATWSDPIRVNDDPDDSYAWQWFGTMSVAPTGRIDVVWLDTRDEPGSFQSSLYYANSIDGGETWSENERMSESFDPHLGWPQQEKMGDYFHAVSDSGGMHLAWAATFNGEQDVYYSYITANPEVSVADEPNIYSNPGRFSLKQNFPNPFNPTTNIQYQINEPMEISISVYDLEGRIVAEFRKSHVDVGEYSWTWNGRDLSGTQVTAGVYFTKMLSGDLSQTIKMILLK